MVEMQAAMNTMHAQMARIQATQDPQERKRLLDEHWATMQSSMETMHDMRGPGMMGCHGPTSQAGDHGMGAGHGMGGSTAGIPSRGARRRIGASRRTRSSDPALCRLSERQRAAAHGMGQQRREPPDLHLAPPPAGLRAGRIARGTELQLSAGLDERIDQVR
jgi:hypothetical protein